MADYDVIVIGGGAAGMSAAICACDAGARVLLAEGQPQLGGSTALSGGWFFAAGTSVQRANGIFDDTPQAMYDYYAQVNQWRIDPPVVRRLCDESAAAFEWLVALGVRFPPENQKRSGMETVARGHQPVDRGAEIAAVLERHVRSRDIDLALANRVTEIRRDGVVARGELVTAPAIVIATGGFGQNRELIARLYPSAVGTSHAISAAGSQGDAIGFAAEVGADICGFDTGLMIPGATLAGAVTGPLGWAVLVNPKGQRFIQEDSYYSVMSAALAREGGVAWAIFDEPTRRGAPADPSFGDLLGDYDLPDARVVELAPHAYRAPTLAALAARLDMANPAVLEASARRMTHGPFYAVRIENILLALTACGLRIDPDARVLDETGAPIAGLFAAGEATGNVLGEMYIASGNSITNCVVYGRIAGTSAALSSRG